MSTTVTFVDLRGITLGQVHVEGDQLAADPLMQSVVDSWSTSGRPGAEFVDFYDGWSNGYCQATATRQGGSLVAAAPLGTGARFAALKAKLAARGDVSDPAALAAKIGRKKYGKGAMQAMAAKGRNPNPS